MGDDLRRKRLKYFEGKTSPSSDEETKEDPAHEAPEGKSPEGKSPAGPQATGPNCGVIADVVNAQCQIILQNFLSTFMARWPEVQPGPSGLSTSQINDNATDSVVIAQQEVQPGPSGLRTSKVQEDTAATAITESEIMAWQEAQPGPSGLRASQLQGKNEVVVIDSDSDSSSLLDCGVNAYLKGSKENPLPKSHQNTKKSIKGKAKKDKTQVLMKIVETFFKKGKRKKAVYPDSDSHSDSSEAGSENSGEDTRVKPATRKKPTEKKKAPEKEKEKPTDTPTKGLCAVCSENVPNCLLKCSHLFCERCLIRVKDNKGKCPLCRYPFRTWRKIFNG